MSQLKLNFHMMKTRQKYLEEHKKGSITCHYDNSQVCFDEEKGEIVSYGSTGYFFLPTVKLLMK